MAITVRKLVLAAAALLMAGGTVYVVRHDSSFAATQPAAPAAVGQPAPVPALATKVQSITVPIRDQARSKSYYVNGLGFTVVKETAGRLEVSPPWGTGSATVVLSTQSGMTAGSARGLFWEVADCPSAVAAIRARGVAVGDCYEAPPGLLADFTDVDGNVWTVSTCVAGTYAEGTLATVGVPVSNQDQSLGFYVDTLGFTITEDRPNPAPFPGRYLEVAAPNGGARLTLSVWWDSMPPGSRRGLSLGSNNVAATVQELRDKGVPVDENNGFNDPDGNTWTVTQMAAMG